MSQATEKKTGKNKKNDKQQTERMTSNKQKETTSNKLRNNELQMREKKGRGK